MNLTVELEPMGLCLWRIADAATDESRRGRSWAVEGSAAPDPQDVHLRNIRIRVLAQRQKATALRSGACGETKWA